MIRGRVFRSVPDTYDEPGTKTKDFNNESQYPSHLHFVEISLGRLRLYELTGPRCEKIGKISEWPA